jgi:hypothetical protein
MSDDRNRRQREHDRLVVQVNLELQPAPTHALLGQIAAADPELCERLASGEKWINMKLDAFLAGTSDNLENVRAAWQDWIRLYRYGTSLVSTGESKGPDSPPTTTAHRGPDRRLSNE